LWIHPRTTPLLEHHLETFFLGDESLGGKIISRIKINVNEIDFGDEN